MGAPVGARGELGIFAYSYHIGRHVANTALPSFRGLVQNIVNIDLLVLLDQCVEVLLEKDILGRNIGKDKINTGHVTILAAADDGPDDLQHRRDASTASNHAKMLHHVWFVNEGALGPTYPDSLTDDEGGHVLGDIALRIGLDQEIKVARLVVARDRGV